MGISGRKSALQFYSLAIRPPGKIYRYSHGTARGIVILDDLMDGPRGLSLGRMKLNWLQKMLATAKGYWRRSLWNGVMMMNE